MLLHSIKVSLLFLPLTTVMGPRASWRVCFEYRLTRLFKRVVLPTPDGPTIATITGGGISSGVRSTRGTCKRVCSRSTFLRPWRSARRPDFGAKAYKENEKVMYTRQVIYYFFVCARVLLFFRPGWSMGLVFWVLHKDGSFLE